jgi:hypothetical protein
MAALTIVSLEGLSDTVRLFPAMPVPLDSHSLVREQAAHTETSSIINFTTQPARGPLADSNSRQLQQLRTGTAAPAYGELWKAARRKTRICVPSHLVITPLVLLGLAAKMPTIWVERIVESLVDELDRRAGDCDCEPEVDCDVEDLPLPPHWTPA